MTEQWREIPGYEGYYEVSDSGRVRSMERYVKGRHGYPAKKRARIRVLADHPHGYKAICLSKNGENVTYLVHRLVMLAFVGACPAGQEVCHNDGSRTNNNLSNLRYGTRAENVQDTVKHGNSLFGVRNPNAKLTPDDVRAIRRIRANGGGSLKAIGEMFGVSPMTVHHIVKRTNWKHVK